MKKLTHNQIIHLFFHLQAHGINYILYETETEHQLMLMIIVNDDTAATINKFINLLNITTEQYVSNLTDQVPGFCFRLD